MAVLKIITFIAAGLSLTAGVYAQNIEWQQVLGGTHSEYLCKLVPTPDYGFLIAGSSFSGESGNKTGEGKGNLDFFLWKMDESGRMEWQKSFGGSANDFLYSATLTKEGGFILGGSSNSPKSGDKKEDGYGNMDFWLLKLNPEGKEEWQKTLGGLGNDQLQIVRQTPDGGYIVGGSSDSSGPEDDTINSVKSQDSYGSMDYWVIKLNADGEIEWEKTYGGTFRDELKDIAITGDGYLVGGNSNSGLSGNKLTDNTGQNDFWLIRTDEKGNEIWQKNYGGEGDENLSGILATANGFLLAGSSARAQKGQKTNNDGGTDFRVISIDKDGVSLWDNTYDIGKWDVLVSLSGAGEDEYLLGGYASSETLGRRTDNKGINDFVVIKINSRGESLWQKSVGGTGTDQLKGVVQMRDGGYLLAGNSDSKKSDDKDRASTGGSDYWIVKLGNENKQAEDRKLIEVFPNPTYRFANIVIAEDFREAKAEVFDLNGRKLQSRDLPYRSTAIDLQAYPPGVYVFKILVDGNVEDVKVIKKGN